MSDGVYEAMSRDMLKLAERYEKAEAELSSLREQAERLAVALRDVNVALQSGRAGRLMTAEEVRQHDAIHAIVSDALASLRKAEDK